MEFRFDFALTVDKLTQPSLAGADALGKLQSKLVAAARAVEKLDSVLDKAGGKLGNFFKDLQGSGGAESGLSRVAKQLEHVGRAAAAARGSAGRGTNMAKIADDWQKMAEKADKAEQKKTQALEREAAKRQKVLDQETKAAERAAERQAKAAAKQAEKDAHKYYFGGHKSVRDLFVNEGQDMISQRVRGGARGLMGMAAGGALGLGLSALGSGLSLAGDAGSAGLDLGLDFGKRGITGQALRENSVAGFDSIFGGSQGNGKQSTYSVGDKLFDQAVRIAKLTKFDTAPVVEEFNTLAASGFSADNLGDVFAGYADVGSARGEGYARRYGTGLAKLNAQQNATFASFQQASMAGPGLKLAEETLAKRLGISQEGDLDSRLREMFRNKKISGQAAIEGVLFATSERYDQGGQLGGYARKQGEGTWEGLLSNIKNGLNDVLTMKLDPSHPMMKFKGLLIEVNKLFDEQTDRGRAFQSLMSKVLEDVFLVFNIDPAQSGKAIDNMLGLATQLEAQLHKAAVWIAEHITRPLVDGAGMGDFTSKLTGLVKDLGVIIGEGIYEGVKMAALGSAKGLIGGTVDAVADTPRAAAAAVGGIGDFLMGDSLLTGARQLGQWALGSSMLDSVLPDSVPRMAEGGTVDGPTLALIGERGREHVVPDDKMGSMSSGVHIHGDVILQLPNGAGGRSGTEYGEEAAAAFMRWIGMQGRNPSPGTITG